MNRIIPAILTVIALVVLSPFTAADPGEVYRLVNARLALMEQVAAYKWHHELPIEDLQREAVVLDSAKDAALRHGLEPGSSRRLFAAQIDAAKAVQRHWFEIWNAGPGPGTVPDLVEAVRPELLRLGEAILAAAAATDEPMDPQAFADAVTVPGLGPEHRDELFQALSGLHRYPHRLEQILHSGVLRIGTTGDYAPFSHRDHDSEPPAGIDIDLGRQLAHALGVRAEFVATSWPALMDDLAAGRFDIGMSGISRTVERQRRAFLSPPYYVGGKTPIARCDDSERFSELAAIDVPGVRVVVNPGGTNERFVDGHIHHARKVLHPDNRSIFDVILAGDADVMITDRVEVELQTARHPELCATMAGNLTYQEKSYLMPQDPVWQAFVATWLDLALAEGNVARVFRDHGIEPRPRSN